MMKYLAITALSIIAIICTPVFVLILLSHGCTVEEVVSILKELPSIYQSLPFLGAGGLFVAYEKMLG